MKHPFLILIITIFAFEFSSYGQDTGTFTDSRDGKIYKTVKIGTQTWFAENLAYKASSGCVEVNKEYAYKYDWETAKVAVPSGWHLPTKKEWETLYFNLGNEREAVYPQIRVGGRSNFDAKDEYFNSKTGLVIDEGDISAFWSSTAHEDKKKAWQFQIGIRYFANRSIWSPIAYIVPFATNYRSQMLFVRPIKDIQTSVEEGKAHILFTRKANAFGLAVPHIVIDKGSGLQFNTIIIQKNVFPLEKTNFDVARNVTSLLLDPIEFYWAFQRVDTIGKIVIGIDNFFPDDLNMKVKPWVKSDLNKMKPNAVIVDARLMSGETISWYRNPGIMRLEVITPSGDQAFSPSFQIIAGKTYQVDYFYMKADFKISEMKD